ncbi:hypothetical protein Pla110_43480 [Polystyrenella longa]|uniref:GYF domain-containing protein n=1 Tax=Polystyrenella longa TaxID=2528007 RepID=A0A518CTP3_9PLAN|nr:DUF4339 domain-containing protein [Polystyrenella longa]QDU82588.1 hypothetical protein Pla110_43480 [Polystyrenella longa]
MPSTWFIKENEGISGPFAGSEMKRFLKEGRIKRDTLLSKDASTKKWIAAGRLSSLFPQQSASTLNESTGESCFKTSEFELRLENQLESVETSSSESGPVPSVDNPDELDIESDSPPPSLPLEPVMGDIQVAAYPANLSPDQTQPWPQHYPQGPVYSPGVPHPHQLAINSPHAMHPVASSPQDLVTSGPSLTGRKTKTVLWLGIGIPTAISLLVVLVFGAWYLGRNQATDAPTRAHGVVQSAPDTAVFESQLEDLRKRREALEHDIRELKTEKDDLNSEKRKLSEEQKRLTEELKDLTSKLESIHDWQSVEFAFVNPTAMVGGVRVDEDGKFRLVKKDTSNFAPQIIHLLRKSDIPRIGIDKKLTQRILQETEEGEPLSDILQSEAGKYWKKYKIVPFDRVGVDSVKFVAFDDLSQKKRRVGFFQGIEGNELKFFGIGNKSVISIPRDQIRIGSLTIGRKNDIIPKLNTSDFLEYAALSIAQAIELPKEESYVNLAIHVQVDDYARDSGKPEMPDPHFKTPWIDTLAKYGKWSYEYNEWKKKPPTLERAKAYLEDELYAVLNGLNLSVLEREYKMSLFHELNELLKLGLSIIDPDVLHMDSVENAIPLSSLFNATHVVIAELKPARDGGEYHLSIRLVEVGTRQVLWAGQSDRVRDSGMLTRQYYLSSGQTALLTPVNDEKVQKSFVGVEKRRIIDPGQGFEESNYQKSGYIVYLESALKDDTVIYRTLFEKTLHHVSADNVSIKLIDDFNEVPPNQFNRYLLSRIVSGFMPSAGRITKIDNDEVTFSLGKGKRIRPGDRMYVLRPVGNNTSIGDPEVEKSQEEMLSRELIVTEVYDNHCTAVASDTGAEDWWPENSFLDIDDIVIHSTNKRHVGGLISLIWEPPPPGSPNHKRLRNRNKAMRSYLETMDAIKTLDRILYEGLIKLNVPMVRIAANDIGDDERTSFISRPTDRKSYEEKCIEAMQRAGATHVVGGYINHWDTNKYRIKYGILPVSKSGASREFTEVSEFELLEAHLR